MSQHCVAIIGSSGGGGACESMGVSVVDTIASHLRRVSCSPPVEIKGVVYLVATSGLDFASEDSSVSLYALSNQTGGPSVHCISSGRLEEVNRVARSEDGELARLIKEGSVQAIIAMSCDPEGINSRSINAAIAAGIPIVGTGGKSMSYIASAGGLVVGSSGGSVASTQISRAICFAVALAKHWNLRYEIPSGSRSFLAVAQAVCGSALPVLLASSLSTTALDFMQSQLGDSILSADIHRLRGFVSKTLINIAVSAVTCNEFSQMKELSLLTGACAGAVPPDTSLLLSFIRGSFAAHLLPRALIYSSYVSLLPTAATIVSIGGTALVSGVGTFLVRGILESYISSLLTAVAIKADVFFKWPVDVVIGSLLGVAVSWGSENGYYHTLILPIIALEMDSGKFGTMGCYDVLCLCAPCAGVCTAAFLKDFYFPRKHLRNDRKSNSQFRLGWRGAVSNLLMGDFVEACYPFSLRNVKILLGIRATCALVGGLIFHHQMKSSAYLPLPLSWSIAVFHSPDDIVWISVAFCAAFGIPFLTTLLVMTYGHNVLK